MADISDESAPQEVTVAIEMEGNEDDDSKDPGSTKEGVDDDREPHPSWSVCRWWTRVHGVASYMIALWTLLATAALTATGQVTGVALVYTGLFVTLITVRLVTYCMWKRGEFLMDLCYMINISVIIYIFAFPDNGTLHNIVFIASHSFPLYASVVYANALDLRTYGQLTSCLIHFGPAFCMSLIRWVDAPSIYGRPYGRCISDDSMWCSPWLAVGLGLACTVSHAIPYMMITFLCNEKRLADPDHLNNYIYIRKTLEQHFRGYDRTSENFKKISYIVVYTCLPIVISPLAVVYLTYRWVDYAAIAVMLIAMSLEAGVRLNNQYHQAEAAQRGNPLRRGTRRNRNQIGDSGASTDVKKGEMVEA